MTAPMHRGFGKRHLPDVSGFRYRTPQQRGKSGLLAMRAAFFKKGVDFADYNCILNIYAMSVQWQDINE